jgi:hypothetical protein
MRDIPPLLSLVVRREQRLSSPNLLLDCASAIYHGQEDRSEHLTETIILLDVISLFATKARANYPTNGPCAVLSQINVIMSNKSRIICQRNYPNFLSCVIF